MRKFVNWINVRGLVILASMAVTVTTAATSRVCYMHLYQDKLPENAKKLRKF